MNAVANSANDFIEVLAENAGGSESDTSLDDLPEYYQPIAAAEDYEDVPDEASADRHSDNDGFHFHQLPNGDANRIENGVASLDLSDDEDGKISEEEDEEERMREASDSAIVRAFREDESRRNAPLTPETATRVMEAMRGISFGGLAPDWAGQVPEDQWIDQLRRLRRPQTIGRD
ncbi:hypothetical protein NMG60_11034284 [Bertholletia excelsa]